MLHIYIYIYIYIYDISRLRVNVVRGSHMWRAAIHSLTNIRIPYIERNLSAQIKCSWAEFIGCRSQWPRGLRRGSAAAPLLGLRIRIPPGTWMSVSYECCVLRCRGICDVLITRLEEPYRVWCVCNCEASVMRRSWPTWGGGMLRHRNRLKVKNGGENLNQRP